MIVMFVKILVIRVGFFGTELLVSGEARLARPLLCAVGTDSGRRNHLFDLNAFALGAGGRG